MTFTSNAQINIFALFMLVILFINVYRRSKNMLPDEKLYLTIVSADVLILLADTVQWLVDGRAGSLMAGFNITSTMLYYILNPLPCLLWCYYVRYQFSMDEKDSRAKTILAIPAVLSAGLSVTSANTGWYYSFSPDNRYQRGGLFWLLLLIVLFYLLYAFIYTVANRKKIDKTIYLSLLAFALPPIIGGVIQVLFYGLSLVWPCVALSLLIIYIYIQNGRLNTDHLTGLYNRRQLDVYLEGYRKKGKTQIGGIMLDIDDFKSINDEHGHTVGDQAIKHASSILRKSIWKNGFLARYGGDEFVIFTAAQTLDDVKQTVRTIEDNVALHNRHTQAPYKIKFSVGYDIFKPDAALTREQILSRIDRLMYENKQEHKAAPQPNK